MDKETRTDLWASAVPCFGLVIIKKISKSSPTGSNRKVVVILSVIFPSSIPECRFPHCYQERKRNNPQHVLFCCVLPVHALLHTCKPSSCLTGSRVVCYTRGGLKGARLKGAERRREFWVICSFPEMSDRERQRGAEKRQKHKHIVVFASILVYFESRYHHLCH